MEIINNLENFIKLYDIIYLIYDIMTLYSNSELKTLIMTVKEFSHKEVRIIHLSNLREKILNIYCFSFYRILFTFKSTDHHQTDNHIMS